MTTTIPEWVFLANEPSKVDCAPLVDIFHYKTQHRFLVLHARKYPIEGGGLSGVLGIPVALMTDACRILTGLYQSQYSFNFYRKSDDVRINDNLLQPNQYVLRVEEAGKPFDYLLYKNFHTWRPPTRKEVPSHWFHAKSPQNFPTSYSPSYASRLKPATLLGMQSLMSDMTKTHDEYRCAVTRVESVITVEGAHGVPLSEKTFYAERGISEQLCPSGALPLGLHGSELVNDFRNYLTLDCQPHRLWEEFVLVFYPLSPGEYITYFLGMPDGHTPAYHFKRLTVTERNDSYIFFVRFAHTIFHYKQYLPNLPQPHDALAELVPATNTKGQQKSKKRPRTENTAGDGAREDAEERMEGTSRGDVKEHLDLRECEDEDGENEEGPIAFKMLFEEAEAEGMELSEEMESLVGSYHPDRKRIAQTASEYLERNPAVGLQPNSVLSYPVLRIS
ncbi:hypothetical protein BDP27DRAFT_1343106, partial [Rhodocollybia butyracea]